MKVVRSVHGPALRAGTGTTRSSVAVLAVVALVLGACSGDADDADDDGAQDTVVEEPETPDDGVDTTGDDPAGDEGPTGDDEAPDDGPSADDGSAGGDHDDVLERLQAIEPSPSQVTYEVTYDDPQEGEEDEQMVIATDPPRSATIMDTTEGTVHTIMDQDTDELISCFELPDGWECTLMEGFMDGMEELAGANPGDVPDLSSPEFQETPDDVSHDTIVGRDAVCLHYAQMGDAADVRFCVDEETGVLLRSSGGGDEAFTVEAVDFTTDVDASLFEPPVVPTDVGDLGGLGDLGDLDLEDLEGLDLEDLDLEDLQGLDLGEG